MRSKRSSLFSFLVFLTLLALSFICFGSKVVLAEEMTPPSKVEEAPAKSTRMISDGSQVEIAKLGIKITPPAEWEVVNDYQGLSLVMQEQEPKLVYNQPMFRRNITVAAIQEPSPIDEKRAEKLTSQITETFGKDSMVTNFQVQEHRFFDYQGKNDGLIIYSSFVMGEFNMMQMHMLVSGQDRQFLLTYNDLAERFSKDDSFNKAWQSMVSIQVTGTAPKRYENLIRYGGAGGILFLVMLLLTVARMRKTRLNYMAEADVVYSDNNESWEDDGKDLTTTQTGVWRINGGEQEEEVIASMHDVFANSNPKFARSSVSNFF